MSAPLTFLERKWANGFSNNKLFDAALQTTDRKPIAPLDYDTHKNISPVGRRTMMSIGRWVRSNVDQVRGAVDEKSTYATSHCIAQFSGKDKEWGALAEAWLRNHDLICDVREKPYNMASLLRNIVSSYIVDGDSGVIFCDTPSGYPKLQFIPAHRIGSRYEPSGIVVDGKYKGRRIIDGVIAGDYGEAIAYRVFGENQFSGVYDDVPADSMWLNFIPEYGDQARGISQIAGGLFNWQDISEWRKFELQAQKIGSSVALMEFNEDGEPAPGLGNITMPDSTATTAGTPTGLITETYDGGTIRYFRARSGNELKSFANDRPTANQQAFEEKVTRAAFSGMGWSMDFSLDPTKAGGAQMRIVVEKINRQIELIQNMLLYPFLRAMDGWRICKAIKIGQLPPSDEWYKWTYQGPGRITADEKYSNDVSIAKIRAGIASEKDEIAKLGGYWEDVLDDKIEYEAALQAKCKAAKVDPNRIVLLTPNGNATVDPQAAAEPTAKP